jgi:hypothetical protein
VVLRLFRGEPLDLVSRELGVEIYRLEQWREDALAGREETLKARNGDPGHKTAYLFGCVPWPLHLLFSKVAGGSKPGGDYPTVYFMAPLVKFGSSEVNVI